MNWISTEKRLPELNIKDSFERRSEYVLVCDKYRNIFISFLFKNEDDKEIFWKEKAIGCEFCSGEILKDKDIEYWMSLPDYPNGEIFSYE